MRTDTPLNGFRYTNGKKKKITPKKEKNLIKLQGTTYKHMNNFRFLDLNWTKEAL